MVTSSPIAKMLDHTLLKPEATQLNFDDLCIQAMNNNIGHVCVPGSRVEAAVSKLTGSAVQVASVMSFPHGNGLSDSKSIEASMLLAFGAQELDMVIDVGRLNDKNYNAILKDIRRVVKVAHQFGSNRIVKVILETCLLSEAQIIEACIISIFAGAQYVKTSTGFSNAGAAVSNVRLMKLVVGDVAKVKASGGIRSYKDAILMLKNGASRIGTSNGVEIVKQSQ